MVYLEVWCELEQGNVKMRVWRKQMGEREEEERIGLEIRQQVYCLDPGSVQKEKRKKKEKKGKSVLHLPYLHPKSLRELSWYL